MFPMRYLMLFFTCKIWKENDVMHYPIKILYQNYVSGYPKGWIPLHARDLSSCLLCSFICWLNCVSPLQWQKKGLIDSIPLILIIDNKGCMLIRIMIWRKLSLNEENDRRLKMQRMEIWKAKMRGIICSLKWDLLSMTKVWMSILMVQQH